jgi:putative hydroxymethylpyrimidine transport system permease protein
MLQRTREVKRSEARPVVADGRRTVFRAGVAAAMRSLPVRAFFVAIALIALWQLAVLLLQPPPFILPPPARVYSALLSRPDLWLVDAPVTLAESLIGLILGTLLGILLALAMSLLPPARRLLLPVMVVSQAIPVFAIAPLLALWFGFGIAAKMVMVTIAIFFPVASAYADGLARTDPNLIDLARLYRAGRVDVVRLLRMPAALPSLVTGVRLAAVYAPIGALFGEWVGASSGLGYAMLFANARAQTDVMFAALFLLVAMSVAIRAVVDLATSGLAPWAPETA